MSVLRESASNPTFDAAIFIAIFRMASLARSSRVKVLVYPPMYILYRAACFAYKVDISLRAKIGAGLKIYHPYCIAVGPGTVVGENCTLRHGVTLGNRFEGDDSYPVIGSGVSFGCFSVVVGRIHIRDNVTVPAHGMISTPNDALELRQVRGRGAA